MSDEPTFTTNNTSANTSSISTELFDGFSDREYRHTFADEKLTTFLAFQIRAIREQREWTQGQLGERCDGKAQGWISKLEDPNYGRYTLQTLKSLARAFDCMLEVRFRSFHYYADEQSKRRSGDLRVNSYSDDVKMIAAKATETARAELPIRIDTGNAKQQLL